MSSYLMTTHSIDLIVQAAYKYRVIAKRERTLFGRMLMMQNQNSMAAYYAAEPEPTLNWAVESYPKFTPFARKFKRSAVSVVLSSYEYQSSDDPAWQQSEVKRLLDIVADKNARAAGHTSDTMVQTLFDDDGEPVMTDTTEWSLDADGNVTYHQVEATEMVTTLSAATKMYEASVPNIAWRDVSENRRDPESNNYEASVMVRPIEVIQAERDAERERVREERLAAAEVAREERIRDQAEQARLDGDDDEDDEDEDWDIEEDEEDDEVVAPIVNPDDYTPF